MRRMESRAVDDDMEHIVSKNRSALAGFLGCVAPQACSIG